MVLDRGSHISISNRTCGRRSRCKSTRCRATTTGTRRTITAPCRSSPCPIWAYCVTRIPDSLVETVQRLGHNAPYRLFPGRECESRELVRVCPSSGRPVRDRGSPSATAWYFSCRSDSTSRRTPCLRSTATHTFRSALSASIFRLLARLGGQETCTPSMLPMLGAQKTPPRRCL